MSILSADQTSRIINRKHAFQKAQTQTGEAFMKAKYIRKIGTGKTAKYVYKEGAKGLSGAAATTSKNAYKTPYKHYDVKDVNVGDKFEIASDTGNYTIQILKKDGKQVTIKTSKGNEFAIPHKAFKAHPFVKKL